jgi:hypothetical protein
VDTSLNSLEQIGTKILFPLDDSAHFHSFPLNSFEHLRILFPLDDLARFHSFLFLKFAPYRESAAGTLNVTGMRFFFDIILSKSIVFKPASIKKMLVECPSSRRK